MNYYEHHLGDYAAATAHLSWDEDMAYSRLIRAYYHHEKPIPLDLKDACRLARATTPSQRRAVETVLNEFFERAEDGWHQKRCDEEIARYNSKRAKARGSAQARWNAKRSDSDGSANASETHSERNANALPAQCEGNAPSLQSPVSSLQGEGARARTRRKSSRRAPADFAPDLAYATAQVPDIDAEAEAAKFHDWEFKTPRSDWPATWRNWIRRCKETGLYARKQAAKPGRGMDDLPAWMDENGVGDLSKVEWQ